MIFSIPSGNAIDKLKWFIYLTNEFGAPSEDNIELFIENFGKIIMNGNFKINSNVEKHLTELWSEITSDKNVETVQSGGIDFYTKLSTTKFASEEDIIDYIKSYETICDCEENSLIEIINVEEEGGDVSNYSLNFNLTPELVYKDENGNKYIEINTTIRGCKSSGRLYEDGSVIVYKGSKIAETTKGIQGSIGRTLRRSRSKLNLSEDEQILNTNYKFNNPSGAGMLCRGTASNGWIVWKNARGMEIRMYREFGDAVSNIVDQNKNILQVVRKYSDIPLTDDVITAYITKELIIDIYPREQKIVVNSSTIEELTGKEFNSLEEVTMQYIISTFSSELKDDKDIDEEIKQLYIECLHSWKRLSDDFSIEYLYE